MITMNATDFSRNLSRILDRLEFEAEEIEIIRNKHTVARIIPGAPKLNAMEAFADLYGAISDAEGEAWLNDCQEFDRTLEEELNDPWE